MKLTRRSFGKGLGALATAVAAPSLLRAQSKGRLVVIGGGAAGATLAKYAARDSKGALDVTLVQENPLYTTCFYSNLYLGGMRSFDSITHGYAKLSQNYGIKLVFDRAVDVDTTAKTVALQDGGKLAYDALAVAPGIDIVYDSIEGYSEAASLVMPHSWKAGQQTQILRKQLEAMADGGLFVMAAPPNPYRCPPGPYERVSLVAHYFKQAKPKSKILILDAKNKHSKQALFQEAWENYYEGMIEWVPEEFGGKVETVDAATMTLIAGGEKHKAGVANVIPAQQAGAIARLAGLTDDSGWCPVVPESMASRTVPGVYVVGDACIPGDMPKSAFSANSQAKVAAMAIRHELTGSKKFPPRFRNTCWSTVAAEDAVKVGANYEATEEKIAKIDGFISEVGEDAEIRQQTKLEADGWYAGITNDIFG
ncbi:MAG: NAD(P)/FAD-dependent oxidoreductase [Kiloniellales bacterium]|nr:NAD(P)/FAD-dependent oxidoreductase [Kiloniellales bacterium]